MLNSSVLLLQILSFNNETSYDNLVKTTLDGVANCIMSHKEVRTVIYFGESSDVDVYLTVWEGLPKVVITSLEHNYEFYGGGGFNKQMVFVAVANLQNLPLLGQIYNSFVNVQGFARGIYIIPERFKISRVAIHQQFHWCWTKGFSEIIVLVENRTEPLGFKGYAYEAFPNISLMNLIIGNDTNYFPSKLQDMKNSTIMPYMKYDPPRVFRYVKHNTEFVGYALRIFMEFFKSKNAKIDVRLIEEKVYDIQEIIQKVSEGNVELSVHPFYPVKGVHVSYPIRMTRWCMMVPFKGQLPLAAYYVRPFKSDLWLMLAFILCILSIVFAAREYVKAPSSMDVWRGFMCALRLLTNQTTPMPSNSTLQLPYSILFLLTIYFGFLLVNLYNASLTSFFTTTLWRQQLNNMQDLVHDNISVHVGAFEKDVIMQYYGLPREFLDLLVPTTSENQIKDIINLTTGSAYAAREDLLEFSLVQSKYSKNPSFRFAEECIATLPCGFILPSHSQYESDMNIFIMTCESAGLIEKWLVEAKIAGFKAGILNIEPYQSIGPKPITFGQLSFAWMILYTGHTIAAVVFLFEKIIYRLKRVRIQIHYQ